MYTSSYDYIGTHTLYNFAVFYLDFVHIAYNKICNSIIVIKYQSFPDQRRVVKTYFVTLSIHFRFNTGVNISPAKTRIDIARETLKHTRTY